MSNWNADPGTPADSTKLLTELTNYNLNTSKSLIMVTKWTSEKWFFITISIIKYYLLPMIKRLKYCFIEIVKWPFD